VIRAALAVLATVVLAGCGGGDDEPATTGSTDARTRAVPPEGPGARLETGDGNGGVALEQIAELDEPVYVAQPDSDTDHLYVVERCGRVMRLPFDGGDAELFLDVVDEITCQGTEQGLLSIAFDPRFESNGRFYAYFTDTAGDARVVEYQSTFEEPRAAIPESARELLRIEDFAANHNGGQLQFGPDRMLYIGTGDGGGAGDPERTAQDLDSLLGKILRIDPRVGDPEVLAFGLRNPWRFSFDRATDDLWIGDVGQDALEEVDAASAAEITGPNSGLNFGWSAFEGTRRFNEDQAAPGARRPVLEYPLEGANCAVTGGYVVRDPSVPTLFGRYLYADFCAGELRSFSAEPALSGGGATDDRPLGVDVPAVSSFGEDAYGHVYAVSLEGPVYRLVAG
jgi:glucose/arabinose dehydrogenase